MSNGKDATANAAKELISMVIANVRKGAPKTGTINSRPSQKKKRPVAQPAPVEIVPATPEEVTEQLRKFENMVIIQRLDSLIDMQKMQWEILSRISGLLETLNLVVGDHHQPDPDDNDDVSLSSNSTEALEEMIKAQEAAKAAAAADPYERAEILARKIAKVKNEIN